MNRADFVRRIKTAVDGYLRSNWAQDKPLMLYHMSAFVDEFTRTKLRRKRPFSTELWDYPQLLPKAYSAAWAQRDGSTNDSGLALVIRDGKFPTGWKEFHESPG